MKTLTQNSVGSYDGLEEKISAIKGFYPESLSHGDVRALAEALSADSSGALDIVGFFSNLKTLTRYVPDPVGVEFIKAPWTMVDEIHQIGISAGDCDDLASLAYTLLHSVGVSAELYVAWYGSNPNPTHIFVGVPQKSGAYKAFDLVASKYGETKAGISRVKAYA